MTDKTFSHTQRIEMLETYSQRLGIKLLIALLIGLFVYYLELLSSGYAIFLGVLSVLGFVLQYRVLLKGNKFTYQIVCGFPYVAASFATVERNELFVLAASAFSGAILHLLIVDFLIYCVRKNIASQLASQ